ncbi:hypothetical protein NliqN6_0336 [Naganishia liquefaciens]|uniref:FAM192A/Fyv6 N-terminal domain-containing protein n=1 Tax=Naganishia liquefaciens TaxID=104408 RepID=A0A8H3YC51_9TREE|nr:hypothetical protein NliqN6_0336 [Naganishia liquefaciens]
MDDPSVTGLQTSGSVSSRFVSQNDIDEAKKRKEEEWKAAYARLGQEPPPQEEEAPYDPRSLYERLSIQKETKKEEWDEKMRMANQFRGLDSDELQFLDETARLERERQRKIEMHDAEELAAFKRMQNKSGPIPSPTLETSQRSNADSTVASESSASKSSSAHVPSKKNVKSLLKGVIKKKDTKVKDLGCPSESKTTSLPTATPSPAEPFAEPRQPASSGQKLPSGPENTSETSKKRPAPTPAPALGALGGYDSDESDDSAEAAEPDAKKVKV